MGGGESLRSKEGDGVSLGLSQKEKTNLLGREGARFGAPLSSAAQEIWVDLAVKQLS